MRGNRFWHPCSGAQISTTRTSFEDTLVIWEEKNLDGTNYYENSTEPTSAGIIIPEISQPILQGIQPGSTYGQSDEYSYSVAEGGVHARDFHATILHLLGIDHERLTFQYQDAIFASLTCMVTWSNRSSPKSSTYSAPAFHHFCAFVRNSGDFSCSEVKTLV